MDPLPKPADAPKLRVLLVEDDPDVAEVTCAIVETIGHVCYVARSGSEALALAKDRAPHVALIDIGLPDLDGYEVARALHANARDMYLVALSGYADPQHFQRAAESGFARCLTKPPSMTELRRVVADASA